MTIGNTEHEQVVAAAAPVAPVALDVPTRNIRWSAIIAGVIVTAGIWLLLHALGMGIGLIAVDPEHPSSLRGVGIGTGIWSFLVPLIALFLGGLVTGYLAGVMPRLGAVISGAVLWSLATILSLLLVISLLSGMLGSAARLSGQVAGAAGSVAMGSMTGLDTVTLEDLGLSEGDLVEPLNQRLRAAGKPTVTAEQLRDAARDALRTSVREGRVEQNILIQSLADKTALSREDAQEVASAIEQQWSQQAGAAMQGARNLSTVAQESALEVIEGMGQMLLILFFLMAVGLGAAIGGVSLAVSRHKRHLELR